MLAFWLAIELDKVQEAQAIIDIDPLVQQIVTNLRQNGEIMERHAMKMKQRQLNQDL